MQRIHIISFLGPVEGKADLDRGHALVRKIETHPIELDPDVTSQSKSIHIFLSKCVRSEFYKNSKSKSVVQ